MLPPGLVNYESSLSFVRRQLHISAGAGLSNLPFPSGVRDCHLTLYVIGLHKN